MRLAEDVMEKLRKEFKADELYMNYFDGTVSIIKLNKRIEFENVENFLKDYSQQPAPPMPKPDDFAVRRK